MGRKTNGGTGCEYGSGFHVCGDKTNNCGRSIIVFDEDDHYIRNNTLGGLTKIASVIYI